MKAQILKIAGVKSEEEFYKLFSNTPEGEKAFMKKHGKEFKKAQTGAAIQKAQVGINTTNTTTTIAPGFNINQYGIGAQTMGQMQGTSVPLNQPGMQGSYGFGGINYTGPSFLQNLPSNDFSQSGNGLFKNPGYPQEGYKPNSYSSYQGEVNPETGSKTGMSKAMPYIQAGADVLQGVSMIKEQKNRVKEAKQQAGVTDVQALAAESRDVDSRRQQQDYFGRKRNALMRPITGEELFPVDGVGTNVLARNGIRLQNGGGVFGNPTEIQNTYAPDYDIYDDLGYEPLDDSNQVKQFQYGGNMFSSGMTSQQANFSQYGDMATNLSNRFINQGGQEDAGSKIGGGIGAGIGTAFGGPIGGAIGKFAGSAIGGLIDTSDNKIKRYNEQTDKNIGRVTGQAFAQNLQQQNQSYMEDGGWVSHDWQPQVIAKFGDLDAQDYAEFANKDQFRAGGHLKAYRKPSERAMQTYAMGGELKTHWGGYAEPMSENPYLPGSGETVMFRGKSHDESDGKGNTGIGITYGDNPVEVERGEPATKLRDGSSGEESLVVYGNLLIPDYGVEALEDKNAKGKKFKNYVADLSKTEARQNKLIEKSTNELNSLDVKNSFDRLKLTALEASIKGGNMKLKEIADKKIKAAGLQNAINETAEEYGLVADDLARGKVKVNKEALQEYAEYGKTIKKAKDGVTTDDKGKKITKTERERLIKSGEYKVDPSNPNKIYRVKSKTATSEEKKSASAMDNIPKQSVDKSTGLYGGVTPEQFEEYKKKNSWFPNWDTFDPNDPEDVDNYAKAYNVEAEKRGSKARILPDKQTPGKTTLVGKQFISALLDDVKKETPGSTESDYLEVEDETAPTEPVPYKRNVLMDVYNQALPYIRRMPDEQLDPRQLYGEMYGLASNELEPVDAQFYRPQLDVPYDISLQDQRNEVTAQTRAAQRMMGYNPAAQAIIAAQAYEPLNKITGEEFRLNQAMKDRVYSGNRATLNDAQLKNLAIADTQYQRQSQAKSNTKAVAQAALQSIGDKYVQNALENRKERIQSNLYPQFSFDREGRAINTGQLAQFNIPTVGSKQGTQQQVPVKDASGKVLYYQLEEYDPSADGGVGTPPIKPAKNGKSIASKNGSIVKSYKNL
jgi:hypothetical protein